MQQETSSEHYTESVHRDTELMQKIIGTLWTECEEAKGRKGYGFNKYLAIGREACKGELGVAAL